MIQTETTPNPESLKFLSENTISEVGTEEFQKADIGKIKNLFIKEILNFKGVELVLLSKNFLSVKKTKEISWNELKPMIISHLNHYFENNKDPILKNKTENKNITQETDETIQKIKDVLGFETKFTIKNAVEDLKKAFEKKILLNTFEDEKYFNIKRMQSLELF